MSALTLLQLNCWSGSTYNLNWKKKCFDSYEDPAKTEARYQSTIKQIRGLSPDVITLNECMPGKQYAEKFASDLGYDLYYRTGVSGIILGSFHYPSINITEGDAILAKREYCLKPLGRKSLSGFVFSERFSLNTDNATQVIAVSVEKEGKLYVIGCTHFTASVVDDEITRELFKQITGNSRSEEPPKFSEKEIVEGQKAINNGTKTRLQEARLCIQFMNDTIQRHNLPSDTHIILAGDLNTVCGTPELNDIYSRGYKSVELDSSCITWDVLNPNVIIQDKPENEGSRGKVEEYLYDSFSKRNTLLDHVFVKGKPGSGGKELEGRGDVVLDKMVDGVVASDHFGILATFVIK